jgi:predicted thioesterase
LSYKIRNLFVDTVTVLGYSLARKVVIQMLIEIGMKGKASTLAEREDTAQEVGSGSLLVYATPCMAALMEAAACEAIGKGLAEGETSVGIELNIQHLSATPVGMDVRAEATVTAVEGKIITFEVEAFDEAGPIGKGTHKRALVSTQRFLDKTYAKL